MPDPYFAGGAAYPPQPGAVGFQVRYSIVLIY